MMKPSLATIRTYKGPYNGTRRCYGPLLLAVFACVLSWAETKAVNLRELETNTFVLAKTITNRLFGRCYQRRER